MDNVSATLLASPAVCVPLSTATVTLLGGRLEERVVAVEDGDCDATVFGLLAPPPPPNACVAMMTSTTRPATPAAMRSAVRRPADGGGELPRRAGGAARSAVAGEREGGCLL
ncbi:MAG: hypothetical protein NVSMB51_21020 [Solirubrobacteraceae bacterium]